MYICPGEAHSNVNEAYDDRIVKLRITVLVLQAWRPWTGKKRNSEKLHLFSQL
jgi:hypothetical protein